MMRDEEEMRHDDEPAEALLALMSKSNPVDLHDSTTGQVLNGDLVAEARQEEPRYFHDKDVCTKRPRQEALDPMGKPPITVKWLDVNKGDDIQPNLGYRSRLVAREIRRNRGGIYIRPYATVRSI